MKDELTLEELVEKWSDIEDKIPSVWADWEVAGIELAQDIAFTWNIQHAELIRVIALVEMRVAGMGKTKFRINTHIDNRFAFAGLYPNIQKSISIMPDNTPIKTLLRMLFMQDDFYYVRVGGKLSGQKFLTIMSIIDGVYKGDFVLFDNAGGVFFDIAENTEEEPDRVIKFMEHLGKEHPSWIYCYRINGIETVKEKLTKALQFKHYR